jgi:DNA polymerase-3 subunit epsilon
MTPLDQARFVVCDVETTGMSARDGRVTEICLIKIERGAIVDVFESLVNPRQYIPEMIVRLTGITNAMVLQAPPMEKLINEIDAFLLGSTFVAHNASFDWSFVSQEYLRSGKGAPELPVVCTVRLARRLIPGHRSYGLHNITVALGIPLNGHHRARADTEATAELFLRLLSLAREHGCESLEEFVSMQNRRPPSKPPKRVRTLADEAHELPEKPGVYFFHDARGEVLYIGKAKNLRTRVRSYFLSTQQESQKVRGLLKCTTRISFEEQPSELHALLREARLIEQHQPKFNSALRRKRAFPFLRLTVTDEFPRLELAVRIRDDGAEYFGPFRTYGTANLALDLIDHLFTLRKCEDRLNPDVSFSPCFYHDIGRCDAPCAVKQSRVAYLNIVERVRAFLSAGEENIVRELEERMRSHAEKLEFEEAAHLRDRMGELRGVVDRPVSGMSGVTGQNYMFILPSGKQEVDIYLIRSGQLRKVLRAAQRVTLEAKIAREVTAVYSQDALGELSQETAREMRILSGWVAQKRPLGAVVPVPRENPASSAGEALAAIARLRRTLNDNKHQASSLGGIGR